MIGNQVTNDNFANLFFLHFLFANPDLATIHKKKLFYAKHIILNVNIIGVQINFIVISRDMNQFT